ncbi:MAG TPA: thioredoxin domain-containing protein [Rhizomicrobium sp.]|nr:thioredoxin domain-containing protein [Rhizomicrobium sp.]
MKESWKIAALGGCAGAAVALIVTFGAAALGMAPFAADGNAMHAYLLAHPDVIVEMTNKLQAQQDAQQDNARQAAVNKLGLKAFFDPRVAFITGPANAKTTIVEFYDYNCPYCRASMPAMKKFYETHRNARFAFIEFPIKGPQSTVAARAAMAARQQPGKYVAFHFALMGQEGLVDQNTVFSIAQKTGLDVAKLKADMAAPGVDLALAAAHTLAQAAGIDGTPAFIVNGKIREGAMTDDDFAQMAKA